MNSRLWYSGLATGDSDRSLISHARATRKGKEKSGVGVSLSFTAFILLLYCIFCLYPFSFCRGS
jgi:hypothetical protein